MVFRFYKYNKTMDTLILPSTIIYDPNDYIDVDSSWEYVIIKNKKYNINHFEVNYEMCEYIKNSRVIIHKTIINNIVLSIIEHNSPYDACRIDRIEYDNKRYKMRNDI